MVQSFNPSGILSFGRVLLNPSLAVPHVIVEDIRFINFKSLHKAGINAIAFDKDNTLTEPYVEEMHPPFREAWNECKEVFGRDRIVIVSNSAGTPDDVDGQQAAAIEKVLEVPVLRHVEKKPSGASKLSEHFDTNPHNIAVVGDRLLTDIVYGNSAGMLSIYVSKEITTKGDNVFAKNIRAWERPFLSWLQKRGTAPVDHPIMHNHIPEDFIKTGSPF